MAEFAEGAARLAGAAGVAFGWTPEQFWRSTPAELGVLVRTMAGDGEAPADATLLARLQEQYPDG